MTETRVIVRHAATVLVGQLAVMAFGVTDTIVAGRHSAQALAALSVGAAVYITVFLAAMGVLQALLPTWAELHGARAGPALGRSVRQALYLGGATALAGVAALLFPGALLEWTEVPAALQADVRAYLGVLTLALPPAILFRMFATLNQSLGKPRLVTWLQLAALTVKVPLTVWFVGGGLGVPAQGAAGCGMATVVVNYLLLGLSIALLRSQPLYRPYAIWKPMEPPDWKAIGRLARLGIPAGLAMLVEVTSFTLMALFIARMGTAATAAHQIASNLTGVLYMAPLSISIATSARVSFWLGAREPARSREAIRSGLKLGGGVALAQASFVGLMRGPLANLYASSDEVVAIATVLIGWVSLYHLGDATQVLCVFVLRCYRVSVAPLVAYGVLLWGVGLTGGYLLAYRGIAGLPAMQSPAAFWTAGAAALGVLSLVLPAILWRAVHRYRSPAQSPAPQPA